MFYLSPQLTFLMLGIVPPVSIGAVKSSAKGHTVLQDSLYFCRCGTVVI